MPSGSIVVDRRRLLTVLTIGIACFFLVILFVPASPGYLRPGSAVALGIALINLALMRRVIDWQERWEWAPLVAAMSMTVGLGLAAADAIPGTGGELFLLWFPWIASYAGVLRLRWSLILAGWLVLSMMLAAWANLDLRQDPTAMLITAAVSAVGGCMVMSGLFQWGRRQAMSDPLTSLVSRSGLAHVADPAIARVRERGGDAVLVLIDINRFREVNDALGHEGGDELLRQFARALSQVTPRPAFVGRLGSDEFALVIASPASAASSGGELEESARPVSSGRDQGLRDLALSVLRQLEGPFDVRGVSVGVEASVGIAVAPRDGETTSALLPCADVALSRAKRQGERIGLWDIGLAGVRSWEISLYSELRTAIARDELIVFYQPLQAASTGRIVGVEALVRWRHPTRGLLPPGAFLPIAERSTLIGDMTRWVMDEALRQCAVWRAEGLHVPVSVNLSARMLILDDLPDLVTATLARHHLPSDLLTLEITESALVTQPGRAAAMLRELRSKGVKLSLDDFGTGYSSMEILKALPFDEVKIDRGFVADVRGSLQDAAIVRSVLDLGHRLGLRVVGEGVEDERTQRMMTELGCDILQGDVISRPRPPEHLAQMLAAMAPRVNGDVPATMIRPPARPTSAGAATSAERLPAGAARPEASPAGAVHREAPADRTAPGATATESGGGRPAGSGDSGARQSGARENGARDVGVTASPGAVGDPQRTGRGGFSAAQVERFGVRAPLSHHDAGRVAAVHRYDIAFQPRTYRLDDIAALAAALTGCDIGAITLVDACSEIFLGRFGHELRDVPARVGVASHTVAAGRYLEVPDATLDTRFAHGARAYRHRVVRFLAGVPVRTSDGFVIGAITISDRIPRRLSPGQREALESLAGHTMVMMDARRERALLEVVTDTTRELDQLVHRTEIPAAASLLADAARHLTGADVATVVTADEPGSTSFTAVDSSTRPGIEPIIRRGQAFDSSEPNAVAEVLRTRRPLFVPDAAAYLGFNIDIVQRSKVASVLVTPIPGAGGVVGALCLRWSNPLPSVDPALDRAISLLTGQAGHCVGRMLLAHRSTGPVSRMDSTTGLATRSEFLTVLGHLPPDTGVCLVDLPRDNRDPRDGTVNGTPRAAVQPAPGMNGNAVTQGGAGATDRAAGPASVPVTTAGTPLGGAAPGAGGALAAGYGPSDPRVARFARDLRAVAADPGYLARWSDRQFVLAVPAGGRAGAESAVAVLRRAWRRESTAPLAVGIAVTHSHEPLSSALIDVENQVLAMAAARDSTRTSRFAASVGV